MPEVREDKLQQETSFLSCAELLPHFRLAFPRVRMSLQQHEVSSII
jgi:hypothetical protein